MAPWAGIERRRLFSRATLAACLLLTTGAALAQERGPRQIQIRGCGWLDHEQLIRLTRLELGHLDDEMDALSVDYACGGDDITIGIANPSSGIRVERRVADACCDDVELERTVALLTLGLLRAASNVLSASPATPAELPPEADYVVTPLSAAATGQAPSTPPSTPSSVRTPAVLPGVDPRLPPAPPLAAAPASAALPAATASSAPVAASPSPIWSGPAPVVVERPAPTEDQPVDYFHDLSLGAALRFNNLSSTLTTYGVRAGYRYWLSHDFAIGPWGEATFGATTRPGGEVAVRLFQLGAAGGWRMMQVGALSLVAEALGAASLVQIEGAATSPGTLAADVAGISGSAGLALTPVIASDRVGLCLPLQGGGLFRAPRGLVSDGAEVQVDGFFLSAGVSVALGLSPRPSASPAAGRRLGGVRP